jgi:hypothetical protein
LVSPFTHRVLPVWPRSPTPNTSPARSSSPGHRAPTKQVFACALSTRICRRPEGCSRFIKFGGSISPRESRVCLTCAAQQRYSTVARSQAGRRYLVFVFARRHRLPRLDGALSPRYRRWSTVSLSSSLIRHSLPETLSYEHLQSSRSSWQQQFRPPSTYAEGSCCRATVSRRMLSAPRTSSRRSEAEASVPNARHAQETWPGPDFGRRSGRRRG